MIVEKQQEKKGEQVEICQDYQIISDSKQFNVKEKHEKTVKLYPSFLLVIQRTFQQHYNQSIKIENMRRRKKEQENKKQKKWNKQEKKIQKHN